MAYMQNVYHGFKGVMFALNNRWMEIALIQLAGLIRFPVVMEF